MSWGRVGRQYMEAENGGGVYYVDGATLCYHPCFPDGRIDWKGGSDVDFASIDEDVAAEARRVGRLLCRRMGLSSWVTRGVLQEREDR